MGRWITNWWENISNKARTLNALSFSIKKKSVAIYVKVNYLKEYWWNELYFLLAGMVIVERTVKELSVWNHSSLQLIKRVTKNDCTAQIHKITNSTISQVKCISYKTFAPQTLLRSLKFVNFNKSQAQHHRNYYKLTLIQWLKYGGLP